MKAEIRTLITYRLERANESLAEANLLLERRFTNTAVNRLYYGCFYVVSALLLTQGLSSAKHTGIRAMFHQHFVKTPLKASLAAFAILFFCQQFCTDRDKATVKQILAGQTPTDKISRYHLEQHGYIVNDNDTWKIRVPLFDNWLRKYVETFE